MNLHFERESQRFYRCPVCGFIRRDPHSMLDEEQERNRYLLHENTLTNKGYVEYLNRFIDQQVLPNLRESDPKILDFGSGPLPVLSDLLKARGYDVNSYDKYFSTDESYKEDRYDLILLLEVIEHVLDPYSVLSGLVEIMKPGAKIILQTLLVDDRINQEFGTWWYKEDMTHISFYTKESFEILARHLGLTVGDCGKNVMIFLK